MKLKIRNRSRRRISDMNILMRALLIIFELVHFKEKAPEFGSEFANPKLTRYRFPC